MTKQELELMDSFNKLEIALSNLVTVQANAKNINYGSIVWNYYGNFIDTLSLTLLDTKKKFHKILVESEET